MGRNLLVFFFVLSLNQRKAAAQLLFQPVRDTAKPPVSLRILPQNFYNQHLSFFCKKELQLQKLTALPVFIRLGSKDAVDYLEKKPNSGWIPKQ